MADGEAHVYGGRLYLVGSTDISGNKNYCSGEYHIWSTDDPRLRNWVDHGVVFRHTPDDPTVSWAPNARSRISGVTCVYVSSVKLAFV